MPSPPDIENILEIKEDSVRIMELRVYGGCSKTLRAAVRHVGSINWQTASSTLKGTDCRKKNLLPDRKYEFRVRAMNRVGWGGWSLALSCKTKLHKETEKGRIFIEMKREKNKNSEDKLAEWIR